MRGLPEAYAAQQVGAATPVDDGVLTKTVTIPADEYGVIEWLYCGFDGSATKSISIAFGGTTLWQNSVKDAHNFYNFGPGGLYDPAKTKGDNIVFTMLASGTGGISGYVSYKIK